MTKENNSQDLAMAMIYPNDCPPMTRRVSSARWNKKALACLHAIYSLALESCRSKSTDSSSELSLPTNSLRMLLQYQIDNLLSVEDYMGLKPNNLKFQNNFRAFAIFSDGEETSGLINSCLSEWIEYDLVQFMERWDVPDSYREELFLLLDENQIASLTNKEMKLFPWGVESNGTASPIHQEGYAFSANDVALLLEGKEIVPHCNPVLKIVGNMSGMAELMTLPIDDFVEGRFSLVCQVSIQTIPTCPFPIIYFDFVRRRWLKSLSDGFTIRRTKKSFLITGDNQKSYSFNLVKKRKNDWKWSPEDSWAVLDRRFNVGSWDKESLFTYSKSGNQILVSHDFDTEGAEKNKLGAGVPEIDRISFFEQISDILTPLGFREFNAFKRIKNSKKLFDNVRYLDNLDFLSGDEIEDDPEEVDQLGSAEDEIDVKEVLNQIDSMDSPPADQSTDSNKKAEERKTIVDLNRSLIASMYPNKQPSLLVIGDNQSLLTDLKEISLVLFDNTIKVQTALLPEGTHGPKEQLEGSEKSKDNRKTLRMDLWTKYIGGIKTNLSNIVCLVQAQKFYQVKQNVKHDDSVNKPAAKLAFSKDYSIPVQYLLPPNPKKSKTKKEKDYLTRIQQALLDLFFGHQGLVHELKKHVDHYFSDNETKPSQLFGITVISLTESNRSKRATIGVASRLDIESGITEIKICHQEADFVITAWLPFKEAIAYVANRHLSILDLGSSYANKQQNFQAFCEQILDDANKQSPGSVVFIKAEKTNSFWGWIKDTGVKHNEAFFDGKRKKQWNSLRIVRVRNQAPKLLQDKKVDGYDKPTTVESIFRIESSIAPVYWSMGSPAVKYPRGTSCYQHVVIPRYNQKTKIKQISSESPKLGQASRPNAVEFTILSNLKTDNPDQLARFSTSLRRGTVQARLETWVRLPAPLFVLEKIKEYLEF